MGAADDSLSQYSCAQSSLFWFLGFKAPTQHLSGCVHGGATSWGEEEEEVNMSWACRSSLLQSTGSASIEKAEPPWPIQQPPRALIQLKMNSSNLCDRDLQSWSCANGDPAARAPLNLLNMKPNLGNKLVSIVSPQQIGFFHHWKANS